MNLILLFERDFISPDRVRLQDRRLKHVIEKVRASPGDELTIGIMNGPVGKGTITCLTPESLEMEIKLDRRPPAPIPVTLVLALPRPKMLKRVLFTAASMGVKKIFLINSFRVEKSYWKSPLLAAERIREHLLLGLEQACDTTLPEVLLRPLFRPFVEDELPGISGKSLALVGHPAADQPCPRGMDRPVTLAVGPEGGFIPYEIDKLISVGFIPVTLGERPLRVETAVPAILSRLF